MNNSEGIIRKIKNLKGLSTKETKKVKKKRFKNSSSLPMIKYNQKGAEDKMINIFEPENLAHPNQLENKMRTLMDQNSIDSEPEAVSYMSTRTLVPSQDTRQLALLHIRPSKENTESSKDFVSNSRKILMKEISIQDKIEETRRLEGTFLQIILQNLS